MDIYLNVEDDGVTDRIEGVLFHQRQTSTGSAGLRLTLLSSKGMSVTWNEEALSIFLNRQDSHSRDATAAKRL